MWGASQRTVLDRTDSGEPKSADRAGVGLGLGEFRDDRVIDADFVSISREKDRGELV